MRNHEKNICHIWENLSYVKNHGTYPIFFIMWDFLSYMGELIPSFNNYGIFSLTWDNLSHSTFSPMGFWWGLKWDEKSHQNPMGF